MPIALNQLDFLIGWICILEREFYAAIEVLDHDYGTNGELGIVHGEGDGNQYQLGRIGPHNVVINCPQSGTKGYSAAIKIAADMRSTFPSIRFVLLVGIGDGVCVKEDIRLGDVVLGNRVASYRSGKWLESGFETQDNTQAPPNELLTAVTRLQRKVSLQGAMEALVAAPNNHRQNVYARPQSDLLFRPDVLHQGPMCGCLRPESVNPKHLLPREARPQDRLVQVHSGTIGCADMVIKNATKRDELAREQGIICFEMEATVIMPTVPCLPVRGISDYSDGHKNDAWHDYAALTAAVCAKELLKLLRQTSVSDSKLSINAKELGRGLQTLIEQVTVEIDEALLQQDGAQEVIRRGLNTLTRRCHFIQQHIDSMQDEGVSRAEIHEMEQQLRGLASSVGWICVKVDHEARQAEQLTPGSPSQREWESLRQYVNKQAQEINRRTTAHRLVDKIWITMSKLDQAQSWSSDKDLPRLCLERVLGSSGQFQTLVPKGSCKSSGRTRNMV